MSPSAQAWCIMTGYPKVNEKHIDQVPTYIQDILRKAWGYQGLVMSDWGATSNAAESIKCGLDLEMPGPAKHRTLEAVQKALKEGVITTEDLDQRAFASLKLLSRTGKFSDRRETPEEKAINLPEHQALIREAGAEGIALLKNKDDILPLNPKKTRKIALLGPLAQYAAAHGGGSTSLNCHYKISPWDAFQSRLGSDVELTHSKGAHIFRVYPDIVDGAVAKSGKPGFTIDYFESEDCTGSPLFTEEIPRSFFTTLMKVATRGSNSARCTTSYTPPISGKHYISFSGIGPSKLFIKGEMLSHQERETPDSMAFFLGVQEEHRFQYDFDAAKTYEIVIESIPSQIPNSELHLFDGQISAHLGLVEQAEMDRDLLGEAVALAEEADMAICFVGNTVQWETEGQDLATMQLPADGSQDALISAVAKANPNVVVVNTTGVPVEVPWLDEVGALRQAWYAGQESGNAILDVILGEVTPSGKLPVSWPKKYEHTACYGNFGLDSWESQQVEYVEGVFVGYRHFDRHYATEKEVQFPFGFGLSYTSFAVSDVTVSGGIEEGSSVMVSASVKNTGSFAGSETVQVYVAPPAGSDKGRPPKALAAFEKVSLQPGEFKTIQVSFEADAAAYWDDRAKEQDGQCWRVESGNHAVLVGTSSRPSDLVSDLSFNVAAAFSLKP
ncbi:hypothetical protein GQ53DRAFT_775053 [Thozetella sp. PMI_491]|nr:hypothetical protein GQ53DRAFT_775053 [Thozetella sp. PMI_491]